MFWLRNKNILFVRHSLTKGLDEGSMNNELSKQLTYRKQFNSFLASGFFCRLFMTYANSLDPDQD